MPLCSRRIANLCTGHCLLGFALFTTFWLSGPSGFPMGEGDGDAN